MNRIIWSWFLGSLVILAAITVVSIWGMYDNGFLFEYYWISESEHLISGFALAMFYSSLVRASAKGIFVWTAIWGLIWEWFEYILSHSPFLLAILNNILLVDNYLTSWPDTILDILLNFAGAILFILIIKKRG